MKKNIKKIRNIGIIAHIDAGKTTVTERILYYTGKSHKMGEVHDGEAIMDWMVDEQERGITITSAVTTCKWSENTIQLIDTPGHVDFTIEVERSLRILDGALGIFCAVGGVEAQSETVWRQADKYNIPKIAFINKLDRIGANFFRTVNSIKEKLEVIPLIIQIPIEKEKKFSSIIDLVSMKQIEWDDKSLGIKFLKKEIDKSNLPFAKKYREKLIEHLSEYNDQIMEKYLTNNDIKEELIIKTIKNATIKLKIVPVLCGSALKNKGIQPLLDGIVNFLPSPIDGPSIEGLYLETGKKINYTPDKSQFLSALIFKISIIGGRKISFVRIYSGKITSGNYVYNPIQKKKEKISRILIMHANRKERIEVAHPGSIVGIIGLKYSITGDTLCDEDKQIILEKIDKHEPVISIAIEPKTHIDQEKLPKVLSKLSTEDPTLTIEENNDIGQILLSGMGELHLEVIISRMQREFNTNVNVGTPQVVYRETITKISKAISILDKNIAGQHHYAEVGLTLIPLNRGEGTTFSSEISSENISDEIIKQIKIGVKESLENGNIMGYPIIDIQIILTKTNIPDSSWKELAYKIAASMAFKKALENASPCLLDPIMDIEIISPESYTGDIIRDLISRGGKITSLENNKKIQIIKAIIPLAKTFGYSTSLRSSTQGRGTFNMQFSKFDIVQ